VKLQWTHAELLTALVAPARRATDGVARVMGLRAEGAEDSIGSESDPPLLTPPLRPDPAWAKAARALTRPGWAAANNLHSHQAPEDASIASGAGPAAATSQGASAALRRAAEPTPPAPFEPLGADAASPPSPLSASLGFEPSNHPLLREAPRTERAAYELSVAPARAAWDIFSPGQSDRPAHEAPPPQAPASLEFEPSATPESVFITRPPGSLEFEPSPDRPAHSSATLAPVEPPPASLEFEPSVASDRAAHTPAALAPASQPADPSQSMDLERLGDAFSDPFVAWRPGGPSSAQPGISPPDEAPLPVHTTRLPLHPTQRQAPPPSSTMELQGAEAPRPLRLRDLGRAGAAARAERAAPAAPSPTTAQRAPLDELFDDAPPTFEALPEGPAFSSIPTAPPRPAPRPSPPATPSPARLRPTVSEAFEPEAAAATAAAPSTRPATAVAPGLPAAPQAPTAAPQAAAGLDRDSLEEAMTEVLRDAARQHGLEV
jgi:hypothetical protein